MNGPTYNGPVDGHNVVSSQVGPNGVIHNHFGAAQTYGPAPAYIPFPENEGFVSRPDIVAELESLFQGQWGGRSAALYGLGGSGKTQLALQYAYKRYRESRCSVFWVHAENETTFTQHYSDIGKALDVAVDTMDDQRLLCEVRRRIQKESQWLLIIDNADNLQLFTQRGSADAVTSAVGKMTLGGPSPTQGQRASTSYASMTESARRKTSTVTSQGPGARTRNSTQAKAMATSTPRALFDYIPTGPTGNVICTTRDKSILVNLVDGKRGIEISRMQADEAETLLERVMGPDVFDRNEREAIKTLLEELQCLPLAISQAASYMRENDMGVNRYLDLLREVDQRWKLLSESHNDRHRPAGATNSVLATWDISINRLEETDKLACKILQTIAFVDNQNIPLELIETAAAYEVDGGDGKGTETSSAGKANIRRAVKRLVDFSFLTKRSTETGETSYEMHKLVQEGVRYRLNRAAALDQQRQAAYTERKHRGLVNAAPLTTSAKQGAPRASGQERCRKDERHYSKAALSVVRQLFPYDTEYENWKQCERYVTHAVCLADSVGVGGENVRVGLLLQNVSIYLHARGRWREKEVVDQKALRLLRQTLDDSHPTVLQSLQQLTDSYVGLGRYNEAEEIGGKVLQKRKEKLGETHEDALLSMYTLAFTYSQIGRLDDAERLVTKARQSSTSTLGELHQLTLAAQRLLANVYAQQHRYSEAEKIYQSVLKHCMQKFGEIHQLTLDTQVSLANIYAAQGRYPEAEKLELQTLKHQRQLLGENHTGTMRNTLLLGHLHYLQGKYDEAEALQLKALNGWQQRLGDSHPKTVHAKHSIASTWKAQGKVDIAFVAMEEVVCQRTAALGAEHPNTIISRATLDRWKDERNEALARSESSATPETSASL